MPPLRNLMGERFGRYLVVGPVQRVAGRSMWPCRCDCGTERLVYGPSLSGGKSHSCGCLTVEVAQARLTKHGHDRKGSRSPEYSTWASMRNRCNRPSEDRYPRYGGRGIRVCDRWNASFEAFLEDVGTRPGPEYQIDRIDNDGNYEPGNVRWVTRHRNMNNRSDNRMVVHDGQSMTLADWARRVGMDQETLAGRLNAGWPVDRALTESVRPAYDEAWRNQPITYDGRSQSLSEWAAELGIGTRTIVSRVDQRGWSIEKALSVPVGDHHRRVEFNGQSRTVPEWSRMTGIPIDAIRTRLARGWTVEATLTTAALKRRKPTDPLEFNGATRTWGEWATESGIPFATLVRRIDQKGWTVGHALTVRPGGHRPPTP